MGESDRLILVLYYLEERDYEEIQAVTELSYTVLKTRLARARMRLRKLMEKDAGGQKDLSEPRVQAQVRQVIFNRKDQTLKNAFSEAARNKATVVNYLAERILATAGKSH